MYDFITRSHHRTDLIRKRYFIAKGKPCDVELSLQGLVAVWLEDGEDGPANERVMAVIKAAMAAACASATAAGKP